MSEEEEVGQIVDSCIERIKPRSPDQIGYLKFRNEKGEDTYFENSDLISAFAVREELKHEIGYYLRMKETEINSRLIQTKCEAYELALTHTRPMERVRGEEEE